MSGRRYQTMQAQIDARAEDGETVEVPEPHTFEINETVYTCREINPLFVSHVMRMQGVRKDDPRTVAFIAEFFELILGPEQYREFLEQTMREGIDETELMAVLEDVMQGLTGRPTTRRSASSGGSPTMSDTSGDDSTSRVLSRLHGRPDLQIAVVNAQKYRQTG